MSRSRPNRVVTRGPIVPDRVRRIDGQSFAFVPHRFLRDGFFASLRPDEPALYLMLTLAGDRYGVSYYHYDSICSLTAFSLERYIAARNGLIDKDLIAFDGTRFQVLSLPARPILTPAPELRTAEQFEEYDPATIGELIARSCPPPKRG